jgi:hypothetical protein
MKHQPEQDMEKYLSEFRPRAVRALETERANDNEVVVPKVARFDWQRLAAAAVLFAALGTSVWYAQVKTDHATQTADQQQVQTERPPRRDLSSVQLTRLALSDKEKFDEVLTERSRESLPNLRGERSTLRILAQE